MQRKHVSTVQLKAEDEGRVTAVVATTGVVDKDGDIIEPGAFGRQAVKVSAFGHASWQGALPIGRGSVREDGNKAVADLEFFMDTTPGRDTFLTLKGLGELAEFSFGFDVKRGREPTTEERRQGARRILQELQVHEVSPVLQGAGIGTGTLALKCDGCGLEVGPELVTQAKATLRASRDRLHGGGVSVLAHPDRHIQALALFALKVGHRIAGGMDVLAGRIRAPRLKWLPFDGETNARASLAGYVVYASLDLDGPELVAALLHEAKHFGQEDARAPGMEADADAFAARWTEAVVKAARWSGRDPHRVHLRDGSPPFYGDHLQPGDVVLSRTEARAYFYSPRSTNAWTT